jgi:hypothetical protein
MNQNANQEWAYEAPDALQVRDRRAALLEFEFVRGPACEPVLHALALDRLPLRARAHLLVCANCRRADAELHSASRRGGFLILLLIAIAAIVAAWLVGSA